MPTPFIVFDGTEGCGKSTQAARLRGRLEGMGRKVLLVRDPGTTRIGESVRSILLDPDHTEMGMRCEMLLYMAARAQMMHEVIGPALDAGVVVLSDRFVSSTLAYQLGGDGLTAAEIRGTADIAIGGRWPQVTVILDLPVPTSIGRLKRPKDRIEQRSMEYHEQVRRNYLQQAAADPKGYRKVNADQSPEEVEREVWAAVAGVFGG